MYLIEPKKKKALDYKTDKSQVSTVSLSLIFMRKKTKKEKKNGETNLIITGQKPIYQSENGKD